MPAITRLPVERDGASAEFFDAAREGSFLLRRAADGTFHAPGVRLDPADPATELTWSRASGSGRLVSWVIGRGRPDESGSQAIVSLGGLIALDEGPWIMAPIECNDVSTLRAGLTVSATYPAPLDGEILPVFLVSPQ